MVDSNLIPVNYSINNSVTGAPINIQYVKAVETVNPWYVVLGIVIIICLCVLGVFMIRYFQKRMELRKDKKNSALGSSIIVSMGVMIILVAILFLTGNKFKPSYIWIFVLVFFIVYLTQWYEIRKLNPMKLRKLKGLAEDHIRFLCLGEPHKGPAFGPPLLGLNRTLIKDQEPPFNQLMHFLYRVSKIEGTTFVYIALSVIDGEPSKYLLNPDKEIIDKMIDKETAEKYEFERELIKESLSPNSPLQQNQNENQDEKTTDVKTH